MGRYFNTLTCLDKYPSFLNHNFLSNHMDIKVLLALGIFPLLAVESNPSARIDVSVPQIRYKTRYEDDYNCTYTCQLDEGKCMDQQFRIIYGSCKDYYILPKPPATVKVDPNKDLIKEGCRDDSGVCMCPVTATHKCGYKTNQDIEDCSGVSYKCEECNKVCPIKAKEGVSKFTMNWQETWKLACHLNHLKCE